MTSPEPCPACGAELPSDGSRASCSHCGHERPLGATSTTGYEAAPAALDPGQLAPHLPQLEILGLLGQGGMGAVYRARQTRLDRLVALKVLPPEAGRGPSFAARFSREARTLARLSHPHIIGVHDFGEADGLYYLLMEYVDGGSLRERMRGGRVSPGEALEVARQICDALEYAHQEGVAHRDIKPENILLDRKGRVKVADFGLAKLLRPVPAEPQLTTSHQVMGTLKYMAPEQLERPLEVDHRADLYALGVVLYEMLTGELPFGRFVLPSEKGVGDSRLDEVILRALERDAARRFQSASEMRAALTSLGGEERKGIVQVPPQVRATSLGDVKGSELTPREGAEGARRRLRGPLNGLLTTGVLAVVFGLFVLSSVSIVLCLLSLAQGALIIRGARQMQRLERHGAATRTSFLALLPLSPGFLVGFPAGIWALLVLNDPAVAAAFSSPTETTPYGSRAAGWGGLLRRIPVWGLLLCFLGAAACFQPFFPWAELQVIGSSGQATAVAAMYGFDSGTVLAAGAAFLTVWFVFLATGFAAPSPRWQPALFIVVGLCAVIVTGPLVFSTDSRAKSFSRVSTKSSEVSTTTDGNGSIPLLWRTFNVRFQVESRGRSRPVSFGTFDVEGRVIKLEFQNLDHLSADNPLGPFQGKVYAWRYIVLILGFALISLGCLQIRGFLRKRQPGP